MSKILTPREKRIAAPHRPMGKAGTATPGTWIIETSGGGGGGGFVPPDAPPVTIQKATATELYDGQFEIQVFWTPNPSANATNFAGVGVYLEDPDMSATTEAPMDGSVTMDGTTQMAGQWKPAYISTATASPADLKVPSKTIARDVRVYLQAFNKVVSSTIVRANQPSPTPNIQVHIPAGATSYVSGQEYALLIKNPHVTAVLHNETVPPSFLFTFSFDQPDETQALPPGLRPFTGVQIVYEYTSDAPIKQEAGPFLVANQPTTWQSSFPARVVDITVYFCSASAAGVNTLVKGVTPSFDISLTYPQVPDVTSFTLTNSRFDPQPDGTIFAEIDATWGAPGSTLFSGAEFWRVSPLPPMQIPPGEVSLPVTKITLSVINWTAGAVWTVGAFASDIRGNLSDHPDNIQPHTPTATWTFNFGGAGGQGQEWSPIVTGTPAVAFEQQINSDGLVMVRWHFSGWTAPASNSFGGISVARLKSGDNPTTGTSAWWDIPKNVTDFWTPWEPAAAAITYDFWFVSRDQQDHRNTILAGVTPKVTIAFTPMVGQLLTSRMPTDWFNTAEFTWDGSPNDFTVNVVNAGKISVGSILRVGGGTGTLASSFAGNQNGQIGVFNAQNQLVGWVGEQDSIGTPDNPSGHSVYGGWFKELYVGGDSPVHAPIYVTNAGVCIVGGWQYSTSYPAYSPYISIRRNDGVEVGRIGASLIYNSGGSTLVPPGDPADIGGAWFNEFAVGGQSLADWRILAKRAQTSSTTETGLVQLRNINEFIINYPQNAVSGQTNAPYTLTFGYDVFHADPGIASPTVFAGISIIRANASPYTHGATLINRGLVLDGVNTQRMIALVTFNGDSNGGDAPPFFGTLTMKNYNNGAINLTLASGTAARSAAYMSLSDEHGNVTFSTTQDGAVTAQGVVNSSGITSSGPILGSSITGSGAITGSSFNTGPPGNRSVIDNSGAFISPAGVNTTGNITTQGELIFSSLWNYGGGSALIDSSGHYGNIYCVDPSGPSGGNGRITSSTLLQINASGVTVTCAQNGIWSGAGVQTTSDIYSGRFGVVSGGGASSPGNFLGLTANSGNQFTLTTSIGNLTVRIIGGLICAG
jgi:hypothetical protein